MDNVSTILALINAFVIMATQPTLGVHPVLILMSVPSPPSHVILFVRTQKAASSVHVLEDTFYKRMERPAKILMNVSPNNTTASSSVSTLLEVSTVNVLRASPSIIPRALIIMNVHSPVYVVLKENAKIQLAASLVSAKEDFPWIQRA